MGKYQKMAAALLSVCMLVCLLAGCNELHSDSYEDIMNGTIIESVIFDFGGFAHEFYNELSVTLGKNGKVHLQYMTDYKPTSDEYFYVGSDYDAEAAEVYMYSGTYTQEDGVLTLNINTMRKRELVRGKEKEEYRDAAIKYYMAQGYLTAAVIFSEDGWKVPVDKDAVQKTVIKIDISGETWKWLSSESYLKNGNMDSSAYPQESGNIIYESYYKNYYKDYFSREEWSPDGIKLRTIYYDENGREERRKGYYEDGSLKFEMEDGHIYHAYDRDGNEIEYYGHNYIDGVCDFCGEAEPPYSEGLKFTWCIGAYIVEGLGSCTDTDIVIPAMYKGYPVVKIRDYAFFECNSITSVTIPGSVTTIGDGAFCNCPNLTTVTVQAACFEGNIRLKSIDSRAFLDCQNLTDIYYVGMFDDWVENVNSNIGSYTVHCANAIFESGNLTSLTIPDGVKTIDRESYSRAYGYLTSVVIPDSVTSIEGYAFSGFHSLTDITYKGTKAQWDEIDKEEYWKEHTGNYIVHCTDGDIAKADS